MLSDSPVRFSEALNDAVDHLDDDELEEARQEAAHRLGLDED